MRDLERPLAAAGRQPRRRGDARPLLGLGLAGVLRAEGRLGGHLRKGGSGNVRGPVSGHSNYIP